MSILKTETNWRFFLYQLSVGSRKKGSSERISGTVAGVIRVIGCRAMIAWTKRDSWRDWASLSEGCYLLRTNVMEWDESPYDFVRSVTVVALITPRFPFPRPGW